MGLGEDLLRLQSTYGEKPELKDMLRKKEGGVGLQTTPCLVIALSHSPPQFSKSHTEGGLCRAESSELLG